MTEHRTLSLLGDPDDGADDGARRDSWQDDWEGEVSTRRRERRMLVRLVVLLLLVAGALYAGGWAWSSERLPRGTTVAGVDVGGMRVPQAERALARALRVRAGAPVRVVVADRVFAVEPAEAGLDVDVPASIAQVPIGRGADPADMWENVVGGSDHPAVVVTIDDLLLNRMQVIADVVDRPAVDGAVRFTEVGAEPVYPSEGEVLNVDAAAAQVAAAYLVSDEPVPLVLDAVPAEVSTQAVSRAMKSFANPATSAPVVYRFGRDTVVLRPTDLPEMLSMEPENGRLEPRLDEEAFARVVAGRLVGIERPAQDAEIVGRQARWRVVPDRDGRAADVGAMADTFLTLAVAEGTAREVRMETRVVRPEVTTVQAERRLDRMRAQGRADRPSDN